MLKHETQVRVRYGETDQMGYAYHGVYLQYYEVGRVEALRSLGLTYREMEEEYGVMMPVVSTSMRFIRPALYDERLTVRTALRKLPDQYITFYFEVFNEQKKIVNAGTVRLCFLEKDSRKRIGVPSFLLERIEAGWAVD